MYTVIIIDDKLNNTPSLISSIDWKKCGFELIGYSDIADEGIRLIENLNPDILIADFDVPVSEENIFSLARKIKPSLEIVFFTAKKDFDSAKTALSFNALEYILKPCTASEFENALDCIKLKLDRKKTDKFIIKPEAYRDYFLISLLVQQSPKSSKEIDNFKLKLNGEEFAVINIGFQNKNLDEPKATPLFFNTIKNIFKKYLNGECIIFNDIITIIISDAAAEIKKNFNLMLLDIFQNLESFPTVKSVIGVSNMFTSLDKIHKAYLEAKNSLLYSFKEKNEIVLFQDIKQKELEQNFFEDVNNNLEKKIKFESAQDVEKFIKSVFDEIKSSKISLSNFYMCLFEMISVCNKIEADEFNEKSKFSFLESILSNKSVDLIEQKICEKCCDLCKRIIDRRQNSVEKIVDQAVMLINENYKNPDFSLKELSENLHISANYLCAIIKKIKGNSFINLLTGVRMEKSKELLLCSNSRIQEIAFESGYTDQHYFSYCFKKYFNMTPKEMRENGVKNFESLSE